MSIVPQGPATPRGEEALIDEIQSEVAVEAAPLLQFIIKHIKLIVLILLIFIAAIVGTGFYQWNEENKKEEAISELGTILTSKIGKDRITALEALLAKAPADLKVGMSLEIAISAFAANEFDTAIKYYGEVAKNNTSALGLSAAINQAEILTQTGKLDEALTVLNTAKAAASNMPLMKSLVLENIATTSQEAKKYDEAVKAYEDIISLDAQTANTAKYYQEQEIAYFKSQIKELQNIAKK